MVILHACSPKVLKDGESQVSLSYIIQLIKKIKRKQEEKEKGRKMEDFHYEAAFLWSRVI